MAKDTIIDSLKILSSIDCVTWNFYGDGEKSNSYQKLIPVGIKLRTQCFVDKTTGYVSWGLRCTGETGKNSNYIQFDSSLTPWNSDLTLSLVCSMAKVY